MCRQIFMMVAVGMTTISLAWSTPARAANEAEMAEHLIELVKIGRGGLSEHQATINIIDATKAEKGFTGDFVAAQVMERVKKKTKIDLRIPDVAQANFYLALVEAERDVVDEAQLVINRQGGGFKGFLHAVFARRVGEHFYKKTGVHMKLTGVDYRNPNNKPDDFGAGSASDVERFAPSEGPSLCSQHDGRWKIGVAYDGPRICSRLLPQLSRYT